MLFVAELTNRAVVFPLKNTIMKLTIWEINKGMVTIKVDTQVSSMVLTIINKDQGGPSNRPQQQGTSLYERITKLEETLSQFMQVSISNHKSTESAIKNLEV